MQAQRSLDVYYNACYFQAALLAVDCCAVFKVHVATKAAAYFRITLQTSWGVGVFRLAEKWVQHPAQSVLQCAYLSGKSAWEEGRMAGGKWLKTP